MNNLMRIISCTLLIATALMGSAISSGAKPLPKRLLVVTVTKEFRHSFIPTAEKVLGELAQKSGAFTVDYVRTDEEMAAENCRRLRQMS